MKVDSTLSLEAMAERIGRLRVGESFRVETESERRHALTCARVLNKKIVTKASDAGGYTITAIPA